MKSLESFGVCELNTHEINQIKGGIWPAVRAIAKGLAALAAYNDICGGCVTARINNSDGSLGGSRPFE